MESDNFADKKEKAQRQKNKVSFTSTEVEVCDHTKSFFNF